MLLTHTPKIAAACDSGTQPRGSDLGPVDAPAAGGRRQRMRIGILAAETGGDQALGKLADQIRRAADDGLASELNRH